jgi:hypothetical protein
MVAGFKQEEIDKMDISTLNNDELQEMVRKKFLGVKTENGTKQKVVSVNEANSYLAKGWEFVAKLSNNKVVIKMNQ